MKRVIRRLTIREWLLAAVVVSMVIGWPVYRRYVLPAYDELAALRVMTEARRVEYARLKAFAAVADQVDDQFEQIANGAVQIESDTMTMSRFFSALETAARRPELTLRTMTPLPPAKHDAYTVYPVRLSVHGKLQQVIQFAHDVTQSGSAIGVKSFTLRGVQGGAAVECTLSLWMVRLASQDSQPAPAVAPARAAYQPVEKVPWITGAGLHDDGLAL